MKQLSSKLGGPKAKVARWPLILMTGAAGVEAVGLLLLVLYLLSRT